MLRWPNNYGSVVDLAWKQSEFVCAFRCTYCFVAGFLKFIRGTNNCKIEQGVAAAEARVRRDKESQTMEDLP